jgi:hypothetical protein
MPGAMRRYLLAAVMRPFTNAAASLRGDVALLRGAPLFPPHIPIHGMVQIVPLGLVACLGPEHWGRRRYWRSCLAVSMTGWGYREAT